MSESPHQWSRKAIRWAARVLLLAIGGGAAIGGIFGMFFMYWKGYGVPFALREGLTSGGILGSIFGAASFGLPMFAVQSAGFRRTLALPYPVAALSATVLAKWGLAGLGGVIAIFAALCVCVTLRGQLQRRRSAYLCQSCNYDLRNLTTSVCPECGIAVPQNRPQVPPVS